MAKKVKCIDCMECMRFALPDTVNKDNVDYVKGILNFKVHEKLVCGITNKTKLENHEQYCNHFGQASEIHKKVIIDLHKKEVEELKIKLKQYEESEGKDAGF